MRRGEAALLNSIDQLRAEVAQGFRDVAAALLRIETNLVNLSTDFRLHVNDGHMHGDES